MHRMRRRRTDGSGQLRPSQHKPDSSAGLRPGRARLCTNLDLATVTLVRYVTGCGSGAELLCGGDNLVQHPLRNEVHCPLVIRSIPLWPWNYQNVTRIGLDPGLGFNSRGMVAFSGSRDRIRRDLAEYRSEAVEFNTFAGRRAGFSGLPPARSSWIAERDGL